MKEIPPPEKPMEEQPSKVLAMRSMHSSNERVRAALNFLVNMRGDLSTKRGDTEFSKRSPC